MYLHTYLYIQIYIRRPLQRSSVWEQVQFSSLLVIRGFGSSRARGSCWARIIPNTSVRSFQILPDRARSRTSVFQGWGPGDPLGAPGKPQEAASESPGNSQRRLLASFVNLLPKNHQKSTEKGARVAPRHDCRCFLIDLGFNVHCL